MNAIFLALALLGGDRQYSRVPPVEEPAYQCHVESAIVLYLACNVGYGVGLMGRE
jgi:hypothetical protein